MDVNLEYYTKSHSVSVKKKINGSIEDVWRLISKPSNLELFHPFCKSNKTIKWPGAGSIDEIIYLNNFKLIREFFKWKKNEGYQLLIGRKGGRKSLVVWKIIKESKDVFLSITVYPHIMRDKPKIISFLPYFFIIKPNMKRYLENVINGLNWHLTHSKPVPKNLFGKHKWFSNLN